VLFTKNRIGGAFLEFVEGKVLPAVAMLEERAKK
jgi:phosphoglycerate kinase